MLGFIKRTYREVITNRKQGVNFWILFSFLPTFLISRAMVYLLPDFFIQVRGTHVHHLAYGIFLLAVAGFLSQNFPEEKWKERIAVLYGIGLALSFDEFGMWLHLQDNYWIRTSYDAVIVILAILINIVYFSKFWQKVFSYHGKITSFFD